MSTCAGGSSSDRPIAATLHYWVRADAPHVRMPLGSVGNGIVCALCGIAFLEAESMGGCPKSKGALLNA